MTAWLRRNAAIVVPVTIVGVLAACGLPERVMAEAVVIAIVGGCVGVVLGLGAGHVTGEGGNAPPEQERRGQ